MQPEFRISEDTSKSPGGLVKQRLLSLTPRVFDSAALCWSLKICISNKFPDDADVASPGTTLGGS